LSTPQQINALLKKHGSPMAGLGHVFVGAGKKYGVDPALVVAISGIESSFGKHSFKPHNAWGWMSGNNWGSWEQGISTVTKGLSQGYIREGLTTPEAIVRKYAPASDGNDERNWARVVNQYLGELGSRGASGPAPVVRSPAATGGAALPPPQASTLLDGSDPIAAMARDNLAEIARDGKVNAERQLSKLVGAAAEATERQTLSMQQSTVPPVPRSTAGTPAPKGALKLPLKWQGTHVTDGLDWNHGKKTAADIMAKAGTPVAVPFDGVVERWGSAQGGEAMYLRDLQTGRRYWLGHVDQRIPEGSSFRAGSVIARISADHAAPHAHWDAMD
jgi:hypothetical protein